MARTSRALGKMGCCGTNRTPNTPVNAIDAHVHTHVHSHVHSCTYTYILLAHMHVYTHRFDSYKNKVDF